MSDFVQIALFLVLIAVSIHFVLFAAKSERMRVIDVSKDFTVKYPRVYLWLCIVFFAIASALAVNMLIWQTLNLLELVLLITLCSIGLPFLLRALVFKIKVKEDCLVYVNLIGKKTKLKYDDIKSVVYKKAFICISTNKKNYKFTSNVLYREYLFKRLQQHGIFIERYL